MTAENKKHTQKNNKTIDIFPKSFYILLGGQSIFPSKGIKLVNQFIPPHIKGNHGQSSGPVVHGLQKELWSDEATVTSEQLTFLFGISQFISPRVWKHAGSKTLCCGLSRGSLSGRELCMWSTNPSI